jgi:nucleoside 2-deoxyribosyltransferase
MKAYISLSYRNRKKLHGVLDTIVSALKNLAVEPFVFVDEYHFTAADEKEMMRQAMIDIDSCDILIAETSDKAIGIGIEVGYAKAKNKPVIYMRHTDAEHSTTVSGISDFTIIYTGTHHLQQRLAEVIKAIVL